MRQITDQLDFREIRPDLLPEQASIEAERCLYCYDAPCREGCPAKIDIPHFIQAIRSNNLKRAARLINEQNPFGSVCGRVCPTERLCEEKCTARKITGKPVSIGRLQSFAVDNGNYKPPTNSPEGPKVAVIGSGPAGLSCARELVRKGFQVTVFESKSKAGGMVSFGVPQYRCSHDVTAKEVAVIESEGVEIRTATPVNQDVSLLFEAGYDAIFVAVGLTKTSRPKLDGMNLKGVYMGLDFLSRIGAGEKPQVGKKAVVVGGGDTALDCARSALRMGAEEVNLIYRRSFTELPADQAEIDEALEEGIIFRTLAQPLALHGDAEEVLRAVELINMKLGNPDDSGRRRPIPINGSNFRIPCNTFIFATGTEPSGLLKRLMMPDVEYIWDKYPKIDPETMETSIPGIFAGGDLTNHGETVVQAVAEGKKAAESILAYLEKKKAEEPDKKAEEEAPAEEPEEKAEETTEETVEEVEEAEESAEEEEVEEEEEETESDDDEEEAEEEDKKEE